MNFTRFIILLCTLASALSAQTANSLLITKRDPTNSFNNGFFLPIPGGGANGLLLYNASLNAYTQATQGAGLTFDGTSLLIDDAVIPYLSDISLVGLSNDYNDLDNLPSLGTAAALNSSAFATAAQGTAADNAQPFITAGNTGQYYRGDKTWVSFPSIPTATSQLSNDSGFITNSDLAPYATTSALTSGLAGKFNTPSGTTAQYVRGDGSLATLPSPGSGTVTSVGLTSSNLTVTGSPITTSGTLTVALPNTGTAGTYSGVTTDAAGRVTAGTTRSFNNAATKTLVTSPTGAGGVVLDASRDVMANYSVSTSSTATIGGASSVTIFLEIATTNSTTAGDWTTIAKASNGQTITLAVILQSVQSNIMNFGGIVPAGYYARIRYAVTGTASATFDSGQEVKL